MITTFSGAFESAGYTLANTRNHWSAISKDNSSVALTVWSDEIVKEDDPWTYGSIPSLKLEMWKNKPGNSVRIKHIRHGIDHCDGQFFLILCKAVDPDANPRKVEWARPWPQRTGIIANRDFNEATGEFLMTLAPT